MGIIHLAKFGCTFAFLPVPAYGYHSDLKLKIPLGNCLGKTRQ